MTVARRWGYEGDVVRDVDSARAFGVPPLPGLFVFDAGHILRLSSVGRAVTEDELQEVLRGLGSRATD